MQERNRRKRRMRTNTHIMSVITLHQPKLQYLINRQSFNISIGRAKYLGDLLLKKSMQWQIRQRKLRQLQDNILIKIQHKQKLLKQSLIQVLRSQVGLSLLKRLLWYPLEIVADSCI